MKLFALFFPTKLEAESWCFCTTSVPEKWWMCRVPSALWPLGRVALAGEDPWGHPGMGSRAGDIPPPQHPSSTHCSTSQNPTAWPGQVTAAKEGSPSGQCWPLWPQVTLIFKHCQHFDKNEGTLLIWLNIFTERKVLCWTHLFLYVA